jgi:hypothetical protein
LEVLKTIFVLEAILLASKLVEGLRRNYVGFDGDDDVTKMANTKNTKIQKTSTRETAPWMMPTIKRKTMLKLVHANEQRQIPLPMTTRNKKG